MDLQLLLFWLVYMIAFLFTVVLLIWSGLLFREMRWHQSKQAFYAQLHIAQARILDTL
jgi:hypothetical protein